MSDQQLRRISPFEAIRHTDDNGDYWMASELTVLLGYPRWSDAKPAIERAITDCEQSGRDATEVFRKIPQNPGKVGGRPKTDYRLTKYACRLVVMAARPRTDDENGQDDAIAAHARTYFSDQIEAAETMDAQLAAIQELINLARERVDMRSRLSMSYDQLEAVAAAMGMKSKPEFARLHNEGDIGMFTMSKEALAEHHHVPPQRGHKRVNMNDHFGTAIMSGINLRNTFASAEISQRGQATNEQMYAINRAMGEEMREMFLRHGITPEEVPPEPHISEAQRIANGQIPLEQMPPMALPDPKDEPPQEGC